MRIPATLGMVVVATAAIALEPREGWFVANSPKTYAVLLADLKQAVAAEKMGVVTEAGPTEAAAARGVTLPGNRVVGVFRPDFAIRALQASEAAMIEAPIRFYVTERPDGSSTLSYKTPSFVFAPYAAEGGAELAAVAAELDIVFAAIAARALE
jgi:uncharacterized protein (DUF302 family)